MRHTVSRPGPAMEIDALKVFEDRIKSYSLVSLNNTDLLLLDIARSLREQNVIAQAGLEWSKSLASLLENSN